MMNWGNNLVKQVKGEKSLKVDWVDFNPFGFPQGLASYNEMCDLYLMFW